MSGANSRRNNEENSVRIPYEFQNQNLRVTPGKNPHKISRENYFGNLEKKNSEQSAGKIIPPDFEGEVEEKKIHGKILRNFKKNCKKYFGETLIIFKENSR